MGYKLVNQLHLFDRGDKTAAKTITCGSVLEQKGYNSMKHIGSASSDTGSMKKILSKVVSTIIGVRHLSEISNPSV